MSDFSLVTDIARKNLRRRVVHEMLVDEGYPLDVGTRVSQSDVKPINVIDPYPMLLLPKNQLTDEALANAPKRGLKQSIADLLFPGLVPDGEAKERILLTNDSSGAAVRLALEGLGAAGHNVVLPAPYFFSFPELIMSAGGKPAVIRTDVNDDFKLTAGALESAVVNKQVKPGDIVLLTSPGNLYSVPYEADELEALAKVMVKYDLKAVSDEMHAHISTPVHTSLAALKVADESGKIHDMSDRVITVSGGSKQFGYTSGDHKNADRCKFGAICASPELLAKVPRPQTDILNDKHRMIRLSAALANVQPDFRRSHWRAVNFAQTIFSAAMDDVNKASKGQQGEPPIILHSDPQSYFACLQLSDGICKKLDIKNGNELSEYLLATSRIATTGLSTFGYDEPPMVRVNVPLCISKPGPDGTHVDVVDKMAARLKQLFKEIEQGSAPTYPQVKAALDPIIANEVARREKSEKGRGG